MGRSLNHRVVETMKTAWILIIAGCLCAHAQQQDAKYLDLRLQSLEGRVPASPVGREDLEVFQETLRKQMYDESRQSDRQLAELRSQFEAQKSRNETLMVLFCAFGAAILAVLFKYARSSVEREVSKAWEAKRETLQKLVRDADIDCQILAEERLLVLHEEGSSMPAELRQLGFTQIRAIPVAPQSVRPDELRLQNVDLLVLAVDDEAWLAQMMEVHRGLAVCYWTRPGRILPQHADRMTFANAKITLFHGLMQAARYRRHVEARG